MGSITPKRSDIQNRQLPKYTILTKADVGFSPLPGGGSLVNIKIQRQDGPDLASYWYELPGVFAPDRTRLGIMEGLVIARFATEAGVNIGHRTSNPVPVGYDDLLSEYGMAVVAFEGDTWKWRTDDSPLIEKRNTLLLSGGADSTHLMFKYLKGNTNAATLYHGQGTFLTGIWPENSASSKIVELASQVFKTSIDHRKMSSRWNCKIERKWAKAYRNFMLVTQAATVFPYTRMWVGTSIDDRLHDSFPEFIESFSAVTGIEICVPNIQIGRRTIMGDLINMSLKLHPYIYASTTSCQLPRYLGKKHFYCGSCHSCLLRLPAVEFEGDPRFTNFNKDLKLIPQAHESDFQPSDYYKRNPSSNILKTFFDDLGDTTAFDEFLPALKFIAAEWPTYNLKRILSAPQYSRFIAHR
jgi:7-cyano-7-deazaguanine synthase in queuosine biosynthesis